MDLEYKIKTLTKYLNIKQILREEFNISNRLLNKLRNNSQIYLNGNSIDINYSSFNIGDIISINLNIDDESDNIVPTEMELKILYEDNYLLIVDKPSNLPVHPSLNHFTDTLSNGVKSYFNSINLHRKIRIVNRLDKDTSRYSYIC